MIDPALEANPVLDEGRSVLAEQRSDVAVEKTLVTRRLLAWPGGSRYTGALVELSSRWLARVESSLGAPGKPGRALVQEPAPVGRAALIWPAAFLAEFPDVDPGHAARFSI
jgi:hypothetical protein